MTDQGIQGASGNQTKINESAVRSRHTNHCFVVMPFGRTADEQRWYRGWYQAVIEPAVSTSGFEPILSASEDHPAAINDEIRSHLVFDPMVVVDLGGISPEESPNPNVMYELGIRHAFGLPLVIMAWEGQRLPFDVSNQRAIMTRRDFMEIDPARQKLIRFIKAAQQGRFYNPMETVGREALIETTSLVLGEDSLLGALASEVRELREVVNARRLNAEAKWRRRHNVKSVLGKTNRSALWAVAQQIGLNPVLWSRFLATAVTPEMQEEMHVWSFDDWTNYLKAKTPEILANAKERTEPVGDDIPFAKPFPDLLLEEIAKRLPEQPWPVGIHKQIADQMNLTPAAVSKGIQELIRRGKFSHQIDGILVEKPNNGVVSLADEEKVIAVEDAKS
jgi:hypothetical protein